MFNLKCSVMEIMLTAHEGNDAVMLKKAQVAEMSKDEFYAYACSLLSIGWQWDDDMQLVYYVTDDNYLLISYYE